jgi:hypothetical protein
MQLDAVVIGLLNGHHVLRGLQTAVIVAWHVQLTPGDRLIV